MENKNEQEWWKMKMDLTLDQWRDLANQLGRMYHESVEGKIVPPVLNDYRWVEKASKCEMTPEELLTVMSIIQMRRITTNVKYNKIVYSFTFYGYTMCIVRMRI